MARSLLELAVSTGQWDAGLKKAQQSLNSFVNANGGFQNALSGNGQKVSEFVSMMGKMTSTASSVKGQMREYQQVIADLTAQFRSLSDEQRLGDIGKAYTQAIAELTEKAGEAKDTMLDVQQSIANAASDTRAFDQITDGATLMTSAFQAGQGAAELLGIELGDNVQVIATLQSAMAVVNGLQQAQNLLQKQSALMMGISSIQATALATAQSLNASATGAATVAQAAFNAVANANPYVLLATAIAAVGTALFAFASASSKAKEEAERLAKAEEEASRKAEQHRNTLISAAADIMATAARISHLQAAYLSCNNEMEKTGILREAQTEFRKLGLECDSLADAQRILVNQTGAVVEMLQLQAEAAALAALQMEAYKASFARIYENTGDINYSATLAGHNSNFLELGDRILRIKGRIGQIQGSLPMRGGGGGGRSTGGGRTTPASTTTTNDDPTGLINVQRAEISRLEQERASATSFEDIYRLSGEIEKAKAKLEQLESIGKEATAEIGEVVVTATLPPLMHMNEVMKQLNERMEKAKTPEEYKVWADILKGVQGHMKEFKGETDIEESGNNAAEAWKNAASAIGQVGSALNSIDNPVARVVGIVAEAIAKITLAFAEASLQEGKKGVWAWIAASAAGLATMLTTISAIKSATSGNFAEGGVIPGNSYSGDNMRVYGLNAGEVVLNRAQAGNLASQLSGTGSNMRLEAVVSGEQLRLVLNGNGRRTGRGELLTTKFR